MYNDVWVTLGDKRPSYCTVKSWIAGFRTRQLNAEGEGRSGRRTQVTVPENVDTIYSMIPDEGRILHKQIAETLAIPREGVGYTIYGNIFVMIKPSAKWIPKYLNSDNKPLWTDFGGILQDFNLFLTVDEA
jgi:hypothetical protein